MEDIINVLNNTTDINFFIIIIRPSRTYVRTHIRFDVSGYPTIKYFPAGSAEAENYEDSREIVDFVAFLNKKAGMNRISKIRKSFSVLEAL